MKFLESMRIRGIESKRNTLKEEIEAIKYALANKNSFSTDKRRDLVLSIYQKKQEIEKLNDLQKVLSSI